jgi:hypothetical protein
MSEEKENERALQKEKWERLKSGILRATEAKIDDRKSLIAQEALHRNHEMRKYKTSSKDEERQIQGPLRDALALKATEVGYIYLYLNNTLRTATRACGKGVLGHQPC